MNGMGYLLMMADGCWSQAAVGKPATPEECWSIVSGFVETICRAALASLLQMHVQGLALWARSIENPEGWTSSQLEAGA
jgi:hypothetical protein